MVQQIGTWYADNGYLEGETAEQMEEVLATLQASLDSVKVEFQAIVDAGGFTDEDVAAFEPVIDNTIAAYQGAVDELAVYDESLESGTGVSVLIEKYNQINALTTEAAALGAENGWADALAQDPGMDGLALGTIICDTYQEGCEAVGTADEITLSITNLTKYYDFLDAYNNFGNEVLANACEDSNFISSFGRVAMDTENYGGNTKEQGYTNMVDLGHLARQASDMLPGTSDAVLSALDDCIEYQISGPYRQEATGLSCYFSLNGDIDDYNGYASRPIPVQNISFPMHIGYCHLESPDQRLLEHRIHHLSIDAQ